MQDNRRISGIYKKTLYHYYIIKKLSVIEIAKILNCSRSVIFNRLKEYKIKIRNLKEARKVSPFHKGKNAHNWKGGRFNNKDGYILVLCPNHPHKTTGDYIFEHRFIMEIKLGRYLNKNEIVHHINGIRTDNRIVNLCLVNRKNHEKNTFIEQLKKRIRYLERKLRR